MRLRTLPLMLALVIIGPFVASVASSETKVGSDVNVAVKIAEAEAQKLIIEELWWLFLVVFDRGIAFVSLLRVTERIL